MAKQTRNELKSFDLDRFFVHFIQNAGASVHNETTQNTLLYGIQNIF